MEEKRNDEDSKIHLKQLQRFRNPGCDGKPKILGRVETAYKAKIPKPEHKTINGLPSFNLS